MDPDTTLAMINDAIDDGDLDEARALMRDLDEWIDKGGYVPVGYSFAKASLGAEQADLLRREILNAAQE